MAANEKYNDLGLDGLESETLLHDDDTLSGLDDLDNFDLDSDLDLNLDDAAFDDDNTSADDLDNLDNLDYSSVESDNDAAVSEDNAPIESDMSDNDIVDYPDAIDSAGEPTEVGDELSDDDLDLSLETNLDDDADADTVPVTPDISDEDIANFDSDSFDDEDESDDDDDDAYGVDLKIGPVTIAFTQVVEPEEPAAEETDDDFGDFGDADLAAEEDVAENESSDDDMADTDNEDLSDLDDLKDIDLEEFSDNSDAEISDAETAEENYDITSDDDLEFDVEQDDALNNIDIDDVLEQNGDESGKMLNIPMPHEDELVVDEEQNAFLSGEPEDVMSEFAAESITETEAESEETSLGETSEDSAIEESTDAEITETDSEISEDLAGFDDTIEDLNSIGGTDNNLISDDDLTALEESMPESEESDSSDENITEATLAGDVVVDEELAGTIEPTDSEEDEDDERIALDGDEDLGIDLENTESDEAAAADDISLDEDLPDTLDEISDADTITEQTADESDIITDEMPSDVGNLDDLDVDDIPAPTTFDEDDEDETIGLSGDELDNILVDADMSETELAEQSADMVDVDMPPTDEELAESINIPEDPSFENDDEFMSDEELAASVSIPGENEAAEESIVDNNIMTNGDLDLYENVDENGSIIEPEEETIEDTKIIDNDNGVDEISDHTIVVPATDDTLSDMPADDIGELPDDAAELETDTIEKSVDDIGDENTEDESETIDLSSFEADLDIDDSAAAEQNAEEESETIDLSSFEADLEPTDGIADFNMDNGVSDEDMNAIADELEDTKIDISEEETNQIYDSLQNEPEQSSSESDTELKQDIKNVLTCLDSLLGALPEEKIKEFAESKEFEAYRRLFEQLDIKHE